MKKSFEFGDMSIKFAHQIIVESKNKSVENNADEKIN